MSNSLLEQIQLEAAKAKREAAKAKLKTLYADYNKAVEVVKGIESQIIDVVKEAGDDPETVKDLLG